MQAVYALGARNVNEIKEFVAIIGDYCNTEVPSAG
jgi:hypothetical protein